MAGSAHEMRGAGLRGRPMSWEDDLFALFDDLESQAGALYDAERGPELADRSRSAYQDVTLASRLMASAGRALELEVVGVGRVTGSLERVGVGWCLVRGAAQDWVLRTGAIALVSGASERSVPEVAWSPVAKLGLGSVLRRLADAGERCVVHRVDGSAHEALLRRVGADFVQVEGPRGAHLVAFDALAAVQSRD